MFKKNLKTITFTLIILLSVSAVAPAQSYQPVSKTDVHPLAAFATGDYIIEGNDAGTTCRVLNL